MKLSSIHWHNGRRYAFSKKYGWLSYLFSDLGAACSGWLPIPTPKHIKP